MEQYRFQLRAYALAARRLVPGATRVRTGLAFLREPDPTPRFVELDAAEDERFLAELRRLGAHLAQARGTARWEGRPIAHCEAIGCGYVYRCHPR